MLSDRIEANPDLFHRIDFKPLLDEARSRVAQIIGADLDEVVFVPNASMGVNNVLRNFDWEEDDIIFACTSNGLFNGISSEDLYIAYPDSTFSHHDIRICLPHRAVSHRCAASSYEECHHT